MADLGTYTVCDNINTLDASDNTDTAIRAALFRYGNITKITSLVDSMISELPSYEIESWE